MACFRASCLLPVIAAALPAGVRAAPASAADGPLREARLLLDGRVRPGAWAVVQASVEAGDDPVRGALSAAAGPVEYRRAAVVPAHTREVLSLPVFLPGSATVPRVSFRAYGPGPAGEPLEPVVHEILPGEILLGVDPSCTAPAPLSLPVREVLADGRVVHWVTLAGGDLQAAPEALDALDGWVCEETDRKAHHGIEGPLGVWLGRGGRLFRDANAARKAVAEGWGPVLRPPETPSSLPRDLLPRVGASPRRLQRGRAALGLLVALGAAAVVLAGWWRPRRGVVAAAVAGGSAAGCVAVLALVPSGEAALRAAAVREIYFPEGSARRAVAEAVEGFAAVETCGAGGTGIRFVSGYRAAAAGPKGGESGLVVSVRPDAGGCEVLGRTAADGRRILRFAFTGHRPAGESLRPRLQRTGGKPVRIEYETDFADELTDAALVDGAAVYPLGGIPPQPAAGDRAVTEAPLDWDAYLRRAGPPGDPARALLAWWGARRGSGAWLIAVPRGDPPMAIEGGAEDGIVWGPVLVAIRIVE